MLRTLYRILSILSMLGAAGRGPGGAGKELCQA